MRDRDMAALARLARSYALRARLGPRREVPATLLRLEAAGLAQRLDGGRLWAATARGRAMGLVNAQRPPAVEPEAVEVVDDEG